MVSAGMTALNVTTLLPGSVGEPYLTRVCQECARNACMDNLSFVWFFLLGWGAYHLRKVVLNSDLKPEAKTKYARILYVNFNIMMAAGVAWYVVVTLV